MKYNFDEIINRDDQSSMKHSFKVEKGKDKDIIPLWVADMDFKVVPEIQEALKEAVDHGIYGYTEKEDDYFQSVANWFEKRFNWRPKKDWLVTTPGIVYAIATAVNSLTEKGDSILIQEPVYFPFSEVIKKNERKLINNPLILKDGRYSIDFEDFERKIKDNDIKMFILCSPHNPVGRVWTKEELIKMGDICLENNVLVVSDEIHCDFVYEGHEHNVFVNLDKKYEENTITCTAPSKSFNLAGLQVSNVFIANEDIRNTFEEEMQRGGYNRLNTMGLVAARAAYQYGEEWLDQLNSYIEKNLNFARDFISENLPGVKLIEPEGSYLLWLDFRGLDLSVEEVEDLLENKAGIWLNNGQMFGQGGEGFWRMNIASPLSIIEKALERLKKVIK